MGRIWAGGLLTAVSVVALAQQARAQEIALDGIVVTSTETSEAAVDTLSASSVVERETLDQFGAQTVTDAVRDIPGVTTQVNQDDPATAVNIRGLQDFGRVNVMVDGARQNFQRSGHNANGFFYLDPEFISTIDITRGPTSTVYGSGAIGGVAAFSTMGLNDVLDAGEKYGVLQRAGIGTNGAGTFTSTAGGVRVTNDFDLFGQFVARDTDKFDDGNGDVVEDSAWKDYGASAKFAIRPAQGAEITGSLLQQHFYDYVSGLGTDSEPRREGETDADTYTLGFNYTSPDNPLIDFSSKIYSTSTETRQDQIEPLEDPQPWRNFKIETTGFDVFNTSRVNTGLVAHKITYGVDGFMDEVNVVDPFSTAALFTPSGERTVWGGFIEDEAKITSWLRVIGAVRYDSYKLEGGGFESDGEHVSPRGTVAVTPVQGLELYGTWAEGYRAPAVTETLVAGAHPQIDIGIGLADLFTFLPNPGLMPEIGQNKELGVNLKYDNVLKQGDKLRGKASVFRNDVEDYIDLVAFGPPTTVTFCPAPVPGCPPVPTVTIPFNDYSLVQYQNIGDAKIDGVEVELAYDWGDGYINVSATHISGKAEDGSKLASIPPDWGSATLGLRFLESKLVLGTRVTIVDGKTYTGAGNALFGTLLSSDAYTLVDLFGSYNFTKWTSLDLTVSNVGDVDYNRYLDSDNSAGIQGRMALTVKLGEDGFDFAK